MLGNHAEGVTEVSEALVHLTKEAFVPADAFSSLVYGAIIGATVEKPGPTFFCALLSRTAAQAGAQDGRTLRGYTRRYICRRIF
jgi:hypothetical protein